MFMGTCFVFENKNERIYDLKNMKNNIKNYLPKLKNNVGKMFISDYDEIDGLWTEYTYVLDVDCHGLYKAYVITVYPEDKTWAVKEDNLEGIYFSENGFKEFEYKKNKLLFGIVCMLEEFNEEEVEIAMGE